MQIRDMLIKKAELHYEIEDIETKITKMIDRVVSLSQQLVFEGDTKFKYEQGSSHRVLFRNHLIPDYFDEFSIDEGIFNASGMYQGAYGYYEREAISFPERWLYLDTDEEIANAMVSFWEEHLRKLVEGKQSQKKIVKDNRRAMYEKLKKEFGDE